MSEVVQIEAPPAHSVLNQVHAVMLERGCAGWDYGEQDLHLPMGHSFTPGMYRRTIFMPGGSIVLSRIHTTEHFYVVTAGRAFVYREDLNQWDRIEAPHHGVTQPGARRFLIIVHDMIWTTYHPTELTDIEEIERSLSLDHHNPLLSLPEEQRKALIEEWTL